MINNIKKIIGLIVGFGIIISCAEEQLTYGNLSQDFSSYKWYTSDLTRDGHDLSTKAINIDTYVAFFDISQGSAGREWVIPESSKFLNKEFTAADSIYTPFIIPNAGTKSNEDLINVLFTEAGEQEVMLSASFNNSVEGGVKVGDVWQVSETFNIDVFANPKPAAKVYRQNWITNPDDPTGPTILDPTNPYQLEPVVDLKEDDNPLESEMDSWTQIEIEAGEKLKYLNQSTAGRADAVKWYADGGKPDVSGVEEVEITYNKLGDYTGYMESFRKGEGMPRKVVSKLIPLKIKVIASTKPFVLNGKVNIDKEKIISFSVTGEVESADNQEGKFLVNVKNLDKGIDITATVESVTINNEDATVLDLRLLETTYDDDIITVSYVDSNPNDSDGIFSVDGRSLTTFDPQNTNIELGDNVLKSDWSGYENEWTNHAPGTNQYDRRGGLHGYWVGPANVVDGQLVYSYNTDNVAPGGSTGSARYAAPNGVVTLKLQGSDFGKDILLLPGTYRVSHMVYVPGTSSITKFTNLFIKTTPVYPTLVWDLSTIEKDKWEEVYQDVTISSSITSPGQTHINISAADNPLATSGLQEIFFDDYKWILLNLRP